MLSSTKVFFSVLLVVFIQSFLFSQHRENPLPPPIEWGVINKADLEMTTFPKDTNANAVILCDYGESFFNNEFNVEFMTHIRIKILNQNGFSWGTRSIILFTKDRTEELKELQGMTYNLDANGNIVKTELNKKDIFEEEVNENYTKYSFTLPALKPGCIIDIKYRTESENPQMRDWVFQQSEPVLWSECRVRFPVNVIYACIYRGYEPWFYSELNKFEGFVAGTFAEYLGKHNPECYEYRYAVKDAPAIRSEPYVTSLDDYKNKISLRLSGYAFPGRQKVDLTKTWKTFVDDLLKDKDFYEKIDDTRLVKKTVEEIIKGLNSDEQKLEAIYNWVTSTIVWNEDYSKYPSDVNDVIESKKGDNADINFLLMSFLKAAGIHCDPVILSTRAHGKIITDFPTLDQFNYVIARVLIGTKTYLIDATDPLRPLDLLPERVLGVNGLIVKDPYEWVALSTDKKNIDNSLVKLTLNDDGSLTGTIEESFGEYKSIDLRDALKSKKAMELVKDIFEAETGGLTIDSVAVIDKDSIKVPLKVKGWISSSSYAQVGGDVIYFNPFIVHRYNENPFKTTIRNFPVEFNYKRSHKASYIIKLPENYELKEPVMAKGASAGSNMSFSRQVASDTGEITVNTKFDLRQTVIPSNEYEQLRNFYTQVVSAESIQLVIGPKKAAEPIVENAQTSTKPVSEPDPGQKNKSNDKKKKAGKK